MVMWMLGLAATAFAQDACPDTPKTEAGLCGCAAEDVDADNDGSADSCVDFTASVDPLATFGANTHIGAYAQVGQATLGTDVTIAARAVVGDGVTTGDTVVLGRRAVVEDNVTLGSNVTLGRSARVRTGVDAGDWLTLGYGSALGANTLVGDGVTLGALTDVQSTSIGNNVVVARGGDVGLGTTLGLGTILGPDVEIGANSTIGEGVRVRKDVTMGTDVVVGNNASIGRDTTLHNQAQVGASAKLRSQVTVGVRAEVDANEYVPRGTVIDDAPPLAIGVLARTRDGWGLGEPTPVLPFKTWLQDAVVTDMETTLTPITTIDAAALADVSAFILVADRQGCGVTGGLCLDPGITASERAALAQFVADGGGLLVFRGHDVGDVITGMFGTLDYDTGCAASGTVPQNGVAPAGLDAYGTLPTSVNWGSNCHYGVTGTAPGAVQLYRNSNAFNEVVVIPSGELSAGSGPVALVGDFYASYSHLESNFSVVAKNLVAFVQGYEP